MTKDKAIFINDIITQVNAIQTDSFLYIVLPQSYCHFDWRKDFISSKRQIIVISLYMSITNPFLPELPFNLIRPIYVSFTLHMSVSSLLYICYKYLTKICTIKCSSYTCALFYDWVNIASCPTWAVTIDFSLYGSPHL